ncbi:MAG TPA: Hsp20/alpha crystallin family protein [Planctomycetota bacterium]|nr:Hsp20/alpha crystallin family protein [Planctomycetota bacterium]
MRRILPKRGDHRRRRDGARRSESRSLSPQTIAAPRSSGLVRLHSELDRLLNRFFGRESTVRRGFTLLGDPWSPSVDVIDADREFTVRAELPGLDPEDIHLALSGNLLVVSGEKKDEHEDKWKGFIRSERRYGSFRKMIPIPAGADPDHVTAEIDRGVLTVHLPKSTTRKPRPIPLVASSPKGTPKAKA